MTATLTVATADSVTLHALRDGAGPPVVVLHGFMGTSEAMEPLRSRLARHYDVVAPDLVGHGRSSVPADPQRYAAARLQADVDAVVRSAGIERPAVVGYSMGGRLGLGYALAAPGRVSRLVLIGSGPGIEDPAARLERAEVDEARARRIERSGVAAFVDEWVSLPLIADQRDQDPAAWEADLIRRKASPLRGLTGTLRGFGPGVMPSLWGALGQLDCPLLAIVGARDRQYFETAQRMAGMVAEASLTVIDDAGHAPHVTHPQPVADAIELFFSETSP